MQKIVLLVSSLLGAPTLAFGLSNISLPQGYSEILFLDDFSSQGPGSLPNSSKWVIDRGHSYRGGPWNWGTGEIQSYTSSPDNLAVNAAGNLQITPLKQGDAWTSGRIETRPDLDISCAPGKKIIVEASIKLPNTTASQMAGIWPAFWMLGSAYRHNMSGWPGIGELDIMEVVNSDTAVYQTLHCGVANGGPCQETNGLSQWHDLALGGFNTFAIEIDRGTGSNDTVVHEESITFYLNRERTWSLTQSELNDNTAWEALAHTPKFILLNVAVGGGFPNAMAGFTTPTADTVGGISAAMEVAYVAVYSS
jgi:beta-glucanase (GH16 family)